MNRISRLKPGGALAALLAVTLLLACSLDAANRAVKTAGGGERVRVFQGAWFEIRYPVDFTAEPSLPSTTADGYDSAAFTAPDGTVSFYVFAPQWGAEAADIDVDPARERLVAERVLQEAERRLRWFTIEANDGSYRRSYVETVAQQGSVKTIVGIKYRDEEARRRYQEQYHLFRESLELFAD